MNIERMKKFIVGMNEEDMKKIRIPETIVEMIRQDPSKITEIKLGDAIAINRYILELKRPHDARNVSEVKHIGIDLGIKNFMNCSDVDMTWVFQYTSVKIRRCSYYFNEVLLEEEKMVKGNSVRRYREPYAHELAKFKNDIARDINVSIANLFKVFGTNTVFVIGNPTEFADPAFKVIAEYFKETLEMKSKAKNCKVYGQDEFRTSLTCPSCYYYNYFNRKKDNGFECVKCGYTHENDDMVAACNIVRRFLEN